MINGTINGMINGAINGMINGTIRYWKIKVWWQMLYFSIRFIKIKKKRNSSRRFNLQKVRAKFFNSLVVNDKYDKEVYFESSPEEQQDYVVNTIRGFPGF